MTVTGKVIATVGTETGTHSGTESGQRVDAPDVQQHGHKECPCVTFILRRPSVRFYTGKKNSMSESLR